MKKTMTYVILTLISLTLFGCSPDIVVDTNAAPIIRAESSYNVEVNDTDFDVASYIYIEDDSDGWFFADSSMIDLKDFDVTTLGDYDVEIEVTDSGSLTTSKIITLHVLDTTPPTIELVGESDVTILVDSEYVEAGVNVYDNSTVYVISVITNNVDSSKVGDYEVEYYARDDSGNQSSSLYRTVHVVDITDAISLSTTEKTQDSIIFQVHILDNSRFKEIVEIKLYQTDLEFRLLAATNTIRITDLDLNHTYTLAVSYLYVVSEEDSNYIERTVFLDFIIEQENSLDEDAYYISKDEVALYLYLYDTLPSNYMTKDEAGSHISSYWTAENMASIGGDDFGNRENLLPSKTGRSYYEVDINYHGGNRNSERIVYSSDGFIFYTEDHYESFVLYDPLTLEWHTYSKNDDIFN